MEEIKKHYSDIVERIERTAAGCGRNPAEVKLVAVAKTFPVEAVAALSPLAPVVIGENRVQEAAAKIEALVTTAGVTDPGLFRWHLVGRLQSNKVNRAATLFEMIHSVDSAALLLKLDRRLGELGKVMPVLIEVNVGGEETKGGCTEDEVPALLELAASMTQARVQGFMCVPPYRDDPEAARPYFQRLRRLRDEIATRFAGKLALTELSMGMSHDFEVAIQEGATFVRIGTAIFGRRR